jgi:perosamine synthetase
MASFREAYRTAIADLLGVGAGEVTLFGRGRVALYAILRSLDLEPGDEVVVPAFTCVAVPNAVLYAGARPVYVDIDPATYTLDPALVEAAITPRTRVILAQNTFGQPADLDGLTTIGQAHGVTVVDDCTHGLGGRYHGRPNGSLAEASFFSTQWSKPLSTGLGGFAVARSPGLATRLRQLEGVAGQPAAARAAILRVLVFGAERAGRGRLFRVGRSAYRALGRLGVVPGSSDQQELSGAEMPGGFLAGLSESQAKMGARRIARLPAAVERRRAIARRYADWLTGRGLEAPLELPDATHTYLRFPLRVRDRPEFVRAAERAGVDLGDWFVSPLHPITTSLDRWGYRAGTAPIAESVTAEIVNLPTEPTMKARDVERVLGLLAAQVGRLR